MKKVFIILNVFLLVLVIVLVIICTRINKEKDDLLIVNDEIAIELDDIKEENNGLMVGSKYLSDELMNASEELANNTDKILELEAIIEKITILDPASEYLLKEQGINNVEVIKDNLLAKPELIGYEGVLGGIMHFTEVYILNYRMCYARFEDGHIQGYGIYKYRIDENAELHWETIIEDLIGSN